ncbi:hypothetical protein E2C01_018496 [Portunus trituberculatus]|uniref:Uncharacterized protein n=1 Tax=Portunus trituberculatus TaxID=210409 RepID=A0A5B7DWA5_PORTR|nr:hypothetical protein [Portunus trituberculatus]
MTDAFTGKIVDRCVGDETFEDKEDGDARVIEYENQQRNWMPAVEEIPMYKKMPNNTAFGTRLSTAPSSTDNPIRTDTTMALSRCSVNYSPFTPTIFGDSPGACVELMTVRAEVWETVRTQAGPMKGAPNNPEIKLMLQESTISQWNPDPLTIFFSGLLKIRLLNKNENFNLLANVLFQEDKEEQEKRCWSCHEDTPHWKGLSFTKWIDDPSSHFWVGWLDSRRHGQLVSVGVMNQVVQENHKDNGDWDTKVSQGTTPSKQVAHKQWAKEGSQQACVRYKRMHFEDFAELHKGFIDEDDAHQGGENLFCESCHLLHNSNSFKCSN